MLGDDEEVIEQEQVALGCLRLVGRGRGMGDKAFVTELSLAIEEIQRTLESVLGCYQLRSNHRYESSFSLSLFLFDFTPYHNNNNDDDNDGDGDTS